MRKFRIYYVSPFGTIFHLYLRPEEGDPYDFIWNEQDEPYSLIDKVYVDLHFSDKTNKKFDKIEVFDV